MMKKRRILSVDNHEDTCDLITTILDEFEVVSAHSKAHGIREANAGQFVLDYYMPDGTGLELSLLIRDFDSITPILFLTSSSCITDEQLANVKAQGVVKKYELPHGLI
ncbi:MAG TPA: response regulator [Pyrinomonadaceae bacterium]|nr:response regulator [Pyrinomonadaceae bacterium]